MCVTHNVPQGACENAFALISKARRRRRFRPSRAPSPQALCLGGGGAAAVCCALCCTIRHEDDVVGTVTALCLPCVARSRSMGLCGGGSLRRGRAPQVPIQHRGGGAEAIASAGAPVRRRTPPGTRPAKRADGAAISVLNFPRPAKSVEIAPRVAVEQCRSSALTGAEHRFGSARGSSPGNIVMQLKFRLWIN